MQIPADVQATQSDRKGYHRLVVWREAHKLVLAVYKATEVFPRTEVFGLTSQMRRSAASVATNIVEGQARGTDAELARFLSIANGSLAELEYQLELSRDLQLLCAETYASLEENRAHVGYLLHKFLTELSLKRNMTT